MCGLVFLSGWVTKEAILESCLNTGVSLSVLVLYYLGIGMTLIYCLRLCRLLFDGQSQAAYTCLKVTYPRSVADPMKCIALQSIMSGWLFFDLTCGSFPAVLRWVDKIVVWLAFLASLVIFYYLSYVSFCPRPPISMLSNTTYLLSSKAMLASEFNLLEDSSLQGLGLANFRLLFKPLSLGSRLLRPQCVLLFFLVLIY